MSLLESQIRQGSYLKSPPRDVVHNIQSYEGFFVNTKIKSGVIVKIIFLEKLSPARTRLILTLKRSGSNTRDSVEKFLAPNGHISCQNPLRLSNLETGKYDDQIVTFQRFEKADVIADIQTSANLQLIPSSKWTAYSCPSSVSRGLTFDQFYPVAYARDWSPSPSSPQ